MSFIKKATNSLNKAIIKFLVKNIVIINILEGAMLVKNCSKDEL